jgi:dTDP-4-dehydrorhamnose reductase/dTDP-4-dehydrorhamnose 3,5-epimerase
MNTNPSPIEFSKDLTIKETTIPGLLVVDIPVHGDSRGWFKENWQRSKKLELGLPDFGPVQNNISFNAERGVTRGIHAEPWDKYISVGAGKIFGAWVDLREGDSFGNVFTVEMDPSKAIFVPRGVGNSFQALENNTVYTYLVNDHWSAEAQEQYTFVNLADKTANIKWPIPLDKAELSDKDKRLPQLKDVKPMAPKRVLVTGANGQLGRALRLEFPFAEFTTRDELDIADESIETARPWRQYDAIINAAAYTAVDQAETPEGRELAWKINAQAVANLARVASKFNLTLVHVSTDYVFNGQNKIHDENEAFSPLSAYGQSKAAGDIAATVAAKHYVVRTGWVVGDGANFVRTMQTLANRGLEPQVVNDQVGRLTFTKDLSKGIKHLIDTHSPYGTYNITNDGESASWAEIASRVFKLSGRKADDVEGVSTDEYFADKDLFAYRPLQSTLDLAKIKATGFMPRDWETALSEYLKQQS